MSGSRTVRAGLLLAAIAQAGAQAQTDPRANDPRVRDVNAYCRAEVDAYSRHNNAVNQFDNSQQALYSVTYHESPLNAAARQQLQGLVRGDETALPIGEENAARSRRSGDESMATWYEGGVLATRLKICINRFLLEDRHVAGAEEFRRGFGKGGGKPAAKPAPAPAMAKSPAAPPSPPVPVAPPPSPRLSYGQRLRQACADEVATHIGASPDDPSVQGFMDLWYKDYASADARSATEAAELALCPSAQKDPVERCIAQEHLAYRREQGKALPALDERQQSERCSQLLALSVVKAELDLCQMGYDAESYLQGKPPRQLDCNAISERVQEAREVVDSRNGRECKLLTPQADGSTRYQTGRYREGQCVIGGPDAPHRADLEATHCVAMVQLASGDSKISGGGQVIANNCGRVVEVSWCLKGKECETEIGGGAWTLAASGMGSSYPVAVGEYLYGACYGKNSIERVKGSKGLEYRCQEAPE
ncbi:hypothetical protein [Arenimonas sp.]|uniref:hypothetical protein n=1 Tax=Arenimonas sp. TaxID=1872635 RepID=UPI0039E241C5